MKKVILLVITAGLIIVYGTFRYGVPGYSPLFPQGGWQTTLIFVAIICSAILSIAAFGKKTTN